MNLLVETKKNWIKKKNVRASKLSALSSRRNGNFANRADDTNVNSTQLIWPISCDSQTENCLVDAPSMLKPSRRLNRWASFVEIYSSHKKASHFKCAINYFNRIIHDSMRLVLLPFLRFVTQKFSAARNLIRFISSLRVIYIRRKRCQTTF